MKGFWNAIKRHKIRTIVVVLIVVLVLVRVTTAGGRDSGMNTETVERRDILTYNSFVGNVEAESERDVPVKATAEALEVLVSEGDTVKKGDVIAQLDTSDVEYTISLQEASLSLTQTANSYNIQDAQRAYDDYKDSLDSGLNTAVLTAKSQMETAKDSWDSARKTYNSARTQIDNGTYDATLSYYSARSEAKSARDNARTSYNDAKKAASDAKKAYKEAQDAYAQAKQDAADAREAYAQAKQAWKDYKSGTNVDPTVRETLKMQADAAGAAFEMAKSAKTAAGEIYNTAKTAYETAKSQSDQLKRSYNTAKTAYSDACTMFNRKRQSTLSNLQDTVDSAKLAYDSAVSAYDAAVLSADQQLEVYKDTLDKTEANADTTASELELQNLKDSLEDYTITAPCDGTITTLNISEGDIVTNGMIAAVISNLNTMEVDIRVDEYSVLNAEAGSDVTIYFDSIDASYEGTLTEIADTATIENGVSFYEATASFTADERVRSGMSVEVRLVNVDEKNVLTLPLSVLNYYEDNTAYVIVSGENGDEEERPVEVGASDGSYVQITEGLEEGDEVLFQSSPSDFMSNTPIGMMMERD